MKWFTGLWLPAYVFWFIRHALWFMEKWENAQPNTDPRNAAGSLCTTLKSLGGQNAGISPTPAPLQYHARPKAKTRTAYR